MSFHGLSGSLSVLKFRCKGKFSISDMYFMEPRPSSLYEGVSRDIFFPMELYKSGNQGQIYFEFFYA